MEISISAKSPNKFNCDMLVYCVRQPTGKKPPRCINSTLDDHIALAHAANDFIAKEGQTLLCYQGGEGTPRLLAIGLGKDDLNREAFRKCGGSIVESAHKTKAKKIMVVLPESVDFPLKDLSQAITEGLVLGNYQFNKYKNKNKTEKKDEPSFLTEAALSAKNVNAARKGMKLGLAAGLAACKARDMANEPGNKWTPQHFASYSLQLAKKFGLKRKVLAKSELSKLKMGGLLGVNQGSAEPPKLIILEYRTGKKVPTLMLVGKGLTFDSGGISIKPSAGMQDMKYDMCGGAAVLTAMQAVGLERPRNLDVVAVVPSTDNMPGGAALKPGDVVRQFNGKTVEIINTDAEGRLILADAISYGIKTFKPDAVVDIATLTGAVIMGLGHHISGLMCNDDKLAAKIERAGKGSGEPVWRLPLTKEYTKQIESKVADLKNVGDVSGGAGTITAGAFLQEFVGDTKWAHIDIAGTAWNFTQKSYIPKGPSGVGVRLLLELIRTW